jgi:Malectin domain
VNSGGDNYKDSKGQMWLADKFFVGGHTWDNYGKIIYNTPDDKIYQTERAGAAEYNIPVAQGDYRIVLHFAEI